METLRNKKISILGDSISTFTNYSNSKEYNETITNNKVFYNGTFPIVSVDEAWWKLLINKYNLKLIVNNSWSGSRVTITKDVISAGCMQRSYNLHNNKQEEPDIILIYLGINDFINDIKLGDFPNDLFTLNCNEFISAYIKMILNIKERYKNAIIYCATLPYTYTLRDFSEFLSFNDAIRKISKMFKLRLVDLYENSTFNINNLSIYTNDGVHPNALGHNLLFKCFEQELKK
jgi:lysophospholipase L1-like esterase